MVNKFARFFTAVVFAASLSGNIAIADDLDPAIKALLTTAYESNDAAKLANIRDVAIATWPKQETAITAFLAGLKMAVAEVNVSEGEDHLAPEVVNLPEKPSKGFNYWFNPKLWNGQVELGGSIASGNNREQALSIGINFKREFGKAWEHIYHFDYDYAERRDVLSKSHLNFDYQIIWKPWTPVYVTSFTEFDKNRFSGYDYRLSQSFGVGYQAFKKENGHALRFEVGPGVRISALDNSTETDTEFLGRISTTYELPISKNIMLKEYASYLFNKATNSIINKTEITAKINSHLAARLSFDIHYNSVVPAGTLNTNTTTRASLVYDF